MHRFCLNPEVLEILEDGKNTTLNVLDDSLRTIDNQIIVEGHAGRHCAN